MKNKKLNTQPTTNIKQKCKLVFMRPAKNHKKSDSITFVIQVPKNLVQYYQDNFNFVPCPKKVAKRIIKNNKTKDNAIIRVTTNKKVISNKNNSNY